uniref:Uncharacterized protein n=1 Tax=Anguilla anguilla TaxID=7936 RepID=A0A0E9QHE2_ANGAN
MDGMDDDSGQLPCSGPSL